MHIIYNETEPRIGGNFNFDKINPNKPYKTHLSNWFYLRFINEHLETSTLEKIQAGKELLIAERKMKFWERHHSFNSKQKELDTLELKYQWNKGE